jgi:tripartite-type tricarboxylate transporter receptor subunit TctC
MMLFAVRPRSYWKEDTMKTLPLAFAILLSLSATSLHAETPAEFYRGKQIRVIVGTAPGDYDTWARLETRYMSRHLPGHPNFVVENMPGAGSLIAANYLYNKAEQDGTVIGSVSRNIPNYAFTKKKNVKFNPLKFNWIGSPELTHRGCYAMTASGVTKAEDLFKRQLLVGTDGVGTSLSQMPILLRNLLGMKFKTVDGYKGSNGVVLAMQRHEVGGICQTVTAFAQSAQDLLDNGSAHLLFTTEEHPVPELKVPTVFKFAKTEEQRNILRFHASSLETGRPLLMPPNVPADRVEAVRRAFDATMKDPAFLAEAKHRKLVVTPRTGEEITEIIRKVASLSPELIAKAGKLTEK